jgi:drug/metabolite transporter (DMT)-like permease
MRSTAPLSIYAKLTVVSIIWGGTFVAGRFLAGEFPPLLLACARFLLASGTLAVYLLATRTRLVMPGQGQVLHLAFLGFFGIFLYNLCFFYGLHFTTASRASLIVAMNPAGIALASRYLFGERLSLLRGLGVLLCIAGAGLVIVNRNGGGLGGLGGSLGDLLILGCVVSWVIYSVFSPNLSRSLGPLLTVTYSIWLGTAMLCGATLVLLPAASLPTMVASLSIPQLAALAYLGAMGSALAYILYYDAIRRVGATRSGVFIALNPVTAVLFGWLLFGESLTPSLWIGGTMVVAGIFFCNRRATAEPVKRS